MGMAAILTMWPRLREQTFVPQSMEAAHGGFIWNMALIRPAVFEEKIFENVDRRQIDANRA